MTSDTGSDGHPRLQAVLDEIETGMTGSLDRLFSLIRIPSISTVPENAPDCVRAADWLARELSYLGFDASVRPTPGHPMVVAHRRKPGAPHVLFYGHYDVQPVDPLELWDTPPFEPQLIAPGTAEARILGRGSSDDKGQLMTFIEACRGWLSATGDLPVSVSILLEGEEESGSDNLRPFLAANRDELRADVALVCDTDMWDLQTPAITIMLRGLVGEEVVVTCASRDLHSGMYGSAARNPIQVLAGILAALRDAGGRVTIPGFYDGVDELPADLRRNWEGLGFDPDAFLAAVGLSVPAGEADRTVLEQVWARPTAEVNGISGGYTGKGFKTVIPSAAMAKVSFRLVGRQDPAAIRAAFRDYVRARIPADCTVSFSEVGGSPAVVVPMDSPWMSRARAALADEWGRETALIGSGGSIPVIGDFQRILGLDSLLIGFAHADDRIHSPNEKYDLASFRGGIRSWARVLAAFAA